MPCRNSLFMLHKGMSYSNVNRISTSSIAKHDLIGKKGICVFFVLLQMDCNWNT